MKNFTFRTNSKVKSLVGQELITNNTIAIFELIKNSYDAGATEVEVRFCNFDKIGTDEIDYESRDGSSILVIDNGKGMTVEEIDKYWMELGNSSKENNKLVRVNSEKMKKIIERFVNGEKGIGRFGVDKIGKRLILESIGENDSRKTTVFFEWEKYDDRTKLLQEIRNEYRVDEKGIDEKSGLSLEIAELREKWKNTDIEILRKNIKKFLSPIGYENEDFKIFFTFYDESTKENEIEIVNDAFSYLKSKIVAELSSNGIVKLKIFDSNEIKYEETVFMYPKGSPFGKVIIEIYYLDKGNKIIFTKRMGVRTSDYGNVKVFRDNFRVMPYGEPHNDWLEIDKAHSQGIFRTFGTRDIIGNIFLNGKDLNDKKILKEATDRVGLIEDTKEFELLKEFVWTIIKTFEKYIFEQIRDDAKEAAEVVKAETSDMKKEASNTFNSFKEMIENIDIDLPQKEKILFDFEKTSLNFIDKIENVEKATEQIEKKIKIYSQMSNKEGILYDMLHSIKNKLSVVNAQINGFEKKIKEAQVDVDTEVLRETYEGINKLVNGSLDKVNASKLTKERISITDLLNEVVRSQEDLLEEKNIKISTTFDNSSIYIIRCIPESLKSVFENLFSNSIKALKEKSDGRINIDMICENDVIEIMFSDNGIGVPKEKRNSLFTLWSSETSGTGLGLASARDTIEELNGEIYYVDLEDTSYSTTFLIKIPRG